MDIPNIEDLIALFETEASGYSDTTPPEFQELKFETTRGSDKIEVEIYAPTGLLAIRWHRENVLRYAMRLMGLDRLEVHLLKGDEFLSATRTVQDSTLLMKLRLKPSVEFEINESRVD